MTAYRSEKARRAASSLQEHREVSRIAEKLISDWRQSYYVGLEKPVFSFPSVLRHFFSADSGTELFPNPNQKENSGMSLLFDDQGHPASPELRRAEFVSSRLRVLQAHNQRNGVAMDRGQITEITAALHAEFDIHEHARELQEERQKQIDNDPVVREQAARAEEQRVAADKIYELNNEIARLKQDLRTASEAAAAAKEEQARKDEQNLKRFDECKAQILSASSEIRDLRVKVYSLQEKLDKIPRWVRRIYGAE